MRSLNVFFHYNQTSLNIQYLVKIFQVDVETSWQSLDKDNT